MTGDMKLIFTVAGIFIGVVGFLPYLIDIFRHKTKPHMFSWLVWSLLTGIGFAGQVEGEGGIGAWITGLNSFICFITFLLSFRYGEKIITRSDKISFIFALLAIPLWLATHTPLFSMILITAIDALGFYPTFRKSWHKPHEETVLSYFLAGLMYVFSLLALEKYTIITLLYPASIALSNLGFSLYAYWRRRSIKNGH